jgi:hypothetical protein
MNKMELEEIAEKELLRELYPRALLALNRLNPLISEQKNYFYEKTEAVIHGLGVPADKADMLRDFAEKAVNLLDKAYPQVETRLKKLLIAIESSDAEIASSRRGRKTLHIAPAGEKFYVSAHMIENKRWIFDLTINKIAAEARFPDVLGLNSEALYYLQAGWRASDELDLKGRPGMTTAQTWQVLAWAAVRPGLQHIAIRKLGLNMKGPSLHWCLTAKDWIQQWPKREGKRNAQMVAVQTPLGLLTWFLGDGKMNRERLKYSINGNEEQKPKILVKEILQAASGTNYSKLLDLLDCNKWQTLKNLEPMREPIYTVIMDHTFWLIYSEKAEQIQARTLVKNIEEAQKLVERLQRQGIKAKTYTWLDSGNYYYVVQLNGTNIARAAQLYPELRPALKELIQKHGISPRGPVTRRLLELADSPPLLAQKI